MAIDDTPFGKALDKVKDAAVKTATDALSKVGIKLKGASGKTNQARGQASIQDQVNASLDNDWRVRLTIANGAKYLYGDANNKILEPLRGKGIIFPYTPNVSVTYTANYDASNIQHSNFKIFQYQNSAVEQVTIGCDFTAQDINEAQYILAVIHFLRSATKMFYGRDEDPVAGTPPPLVYLTGFGNYQFEGHPMVINSFNYQLPTDVDYIPAFNPYNASNEAPTGGASAPTTSEARANSGDTKVAPGGNPAPAPLTSKPQGSGATSVTWVPTKINIQFTAFPVVARNDISNSFSFKDYANGKLLQGSKRPNKAGVW